MLFSFLLVFLRPDDYLSLVTAEALLEACLQDNMELLRSLTPLPEQTQPKLGRAKSLLNAVLSRGELSVSFRSDLVHGALRPRAKALLLLFSSSPST